MSSDVKIRRQEYRKSVLKIITNYLIPPCVAAAAPQYGDRTARLDADAEKKYALIRYEWCTRRGSSGAFSGRLVESEEVCDALAEIFTAHTRIIDALFDCVLSGWARPVCKHSVSDEADIIISKFARYFLVLERYGLIERSFNKDFIREAYNLFRRNGYNLPYLDEDREAAIMGIVKVIFTRNKAVKLGKDLSLKKTIAKYEQRYEDERLARKAQFDGLQRIAQRYTHERLDRINLLIRMFVEKMITEHVTETISKYRDIFDIGEAFQMFNGYSYDESAETGVYPFNWNLQDYLFKDFVSDERRDSILNLLDSRPMIGEIELSLAKDTILTSPWSCPSLTNTFFDMEIGGKDNPFRDEKGEYEAELYLPLGITIVNRRNHRIFSGVSSRNGKITPQAVYDLSALYNELYFDGDVWRDISTTEIVAGIGKWEMAVIFEMCRPRCADFEPESSKRIKLSDTLRFAGVDFYVKK